MEFGTYRHRVNSVGVQIDRTPVLDQFGQPWMRVERWTLDFRLINSTTDPKSLDAAIQSLEAAYSSTASRARLLHDDGTPTAHVLNNGLVGGVRVVKPPSYMRYQNGEHVSYRTGQIVIEANVSLTNDPYRVVELSETIDQEGGGPEFGYLQPNVGMAVRQMTRTHSTFRATQSGRIVHAADWGVIPPPLWPDAQVAPVKMRAEAPTRIGNSAFGFPTTYSYSFEWHERLVSVPHY